MIAKVLTDIHLVFKDAFNEIKAHGPLNEGRWLTIAKQLLERITLSKSLLNLCIPQIEELCLWLLNRTASKLPSVQFKRPIPMLKEILVTFRGLSLNKVLIDGINEILLTSDVYFHERNKESEMNLLREQIQNLNRLTKINTYDTDAMIKFLEKAKMEQFSKKFGVSLLDYKGNFGRLAIFPFIILEIVDQASERMFWNNLVGKNLFQLMIPFSFEVFRQKFDKIVFAKNSNSITFDLTIQASSKFLEPENHQNEEDLDLEIYNKYFQTLSVEIKKFKIESQSRNLSELKRLFPESEGNKISNMMAVRRTCFVMLAKLSPTPQKFYYRLLKNPI